MILLLSLFFNPSVLRPPPLYFAAQNTEEEGEMYSPFASASILYTTPRKAAGHGRGEDWYLILLLSLFFNPSVLRPPPLYFAAQNTEEEGEMYSPFASASILYTTPRKAAGHGRGGV